MSIFNLPCPHNDGKECGYCHGVRAQDGWRFKGCFCHPLHGKFIAEVKECPDKAQKGEQYISKATVVEEIERLQGFFVNERDDFEKGYYHGLDMVLAFLDTLETKDVDLEKELDKYTTDNFWALDGNNESPYLLEKDDMLKVAKYFYELGLKTQKGE